MDFIAIDFETANYARNSAISVGLAKFIGNEQTDSFYSLIRPPRLFVRADFTEIHGLTAADVKDAPSFDAVWHGGLSEFLGNLPLVAHNAGFDMSVLKATLEHYGLEVPQLRYFDSLLIARKVWRDLERHALTFLGEHFGITYNAHNALADAETCGKIVILAAQELCAEGKFQAEKFAAADVRPFLKKANVKFRKLVK